MVVLLKSFLNVFVFLLQRPKDFTFPFVEDKPSPIVITRVRRSKSMSRASREWPWQRRKGPRSSPQGSCIGPQSVTGPSRNPIGSCIDPQSVRGPSRNPLGSSTIIGLQRQEGPKLKSQRTKSSPQRHKPWMKGCRIVAVVQESSVSTLVGHWNREMFVFILTRSYSRKEEKEIATETTIFVNKMLLLELILL